MSFLIIENGSIVTGANSYATAEEIRLYASRRGVTLPAIPEPPEVGEGDPEPEPLPDPVEFLAMKAMDYLEAKDYTGNRREPTQPLKWPRVSAFGERRYPLPVDEIPTGIKQAQCALCIEIHNGVDVLPTMEPGSFIVRDKTGPLETQYSERLAAFVLPSMPKVDALLEPFLRSNFSLRTVRV